MNLDGSDKPCVCRNALQTSLIREKIRRRISSTINCEIQNRVQNYKKIFNFEPPIPQNLANKSIFEYKSTPFPNKNTPNLDTR